MARIRGALVLCGMVAVGVTAPAGNSAQQSAAQAGVFDESVAYERFMGRWSRQLAPLLVKFVGVREGDAVLDIGSGTGALTAAIAQAVPSARIVGVDPAAAYVAYAQARVTGGTVRFVVGDAQQLQLPDRSFDRVVSLLVMNFIPDPAKALREMIRVSRPGAIVAAAVWDYGNGMQMLRRFWDEAVARDPTIAARDEHNMPLCRPGELAEMWRAQGLLQVEEQPLVIQTRFASFDDYWMPFLGGQGPAGTYAVKLPEAQRGVLRAGLRQRLLGNGEDRAINLEARAWAVKGVVPPR
jgi:SAM-dependent methyltransferase